MQNHVQFLAVLFITATGPLYGMRQATITADTLYQELFQAATSGDDQEIQRLTAAGAPINATNNNGGTPLMHAAMNGHIKCIQALMHAGVAPDCQNNDGFTALMLAVIEDKPECVKELIPKANLDCQARNRWTALIFATFRGNKECIHLLVNAGAKLDCQTQHGFTALMWAVINDDRASIEILTNAGADLTLKAHGKTALTMAQAMDLKECTRLLEAAQAQFSNENKDDNIASRNMERNNLPSSIDCQEQQRDRLSGRPLKRAHRENNGL